MNDNLNENIFADDREIDLKDMLFYICKRWRSLLIGTLIIMIVMILIRVPAMTELSGAAAVFKQLAKYALIGIVAGIILMCIVYAVSYVISGKIKSESDFRSNCRMNVLGVLPKKEIKRLNPVDKLVGRMFGVDRRAEDYEALADRLAEEIKALLEFHKTNDNGGKRLCLSVVSTTGNKTAEEMAKLVGLKLKDLAMVTAAGDILKSAKSIQEVMKSDLVLMVERIGVSEHQRFEETYKKIMLWGKSIIGMVLIDGDIKQL